MVSTGVVPPMATGDDETAGPVECWRRWTSTREVPFHRYCVVFPVVRGPDGRLTLNRERPAGSADGTAERPRVRYVRGFTRTLLRFTPLVVLLTLVGYVVLTELSPETVGLTDLLPAGVGFPSPLVTVAVLAWVALLFVPLYVADLRPGPATAQAVAVYGTLLALLLGCLGAVLASPVVDVPLRPPDVGPTEWTILNPVGFLTVAFVGGHLLYDTVLRTETTLSRLPEKHPAVLVDPEGEGRRRYETLLDDLAGALRSSVATLTVGGRQVSLRTSHVFAVVFLIPFLVSRLASLPEMTGRPLPAALLAEPGEVAVALVPLALDVVLIVLLFQFLVVTAFVHRLFSDSPDGEAGPLLRYRPGHPDGQAGFAEFGNYATRINLVLVLAGFYVVYRLYVLGLPLLEEIGASAVTPDLLNWGLLFVAPLVVYAVAVLLWLYFSFWRMHRFMAEAKTEALREARRPASDRDVEIVESAPVWPIDTRLLYTALSLDLLPVLTVLPMT